MPLKKIILYCGLIGLVSIGLIILIGSQMNNGWAFMALLMFVIEFIITLIVVNTLGTLGSIFITAITKPRPDALSPTQNPKSLFYANLTFLGITLICWLVVWPIWQLNSPLNELPAYAFPIFLAIGLNELVWSVNFALKNKNQRLLSLMFTVVAVAFSFYTFFAFYGNYLD